MASAVGAEVRRRDPGQGRGRSFRDLRPGRRWARVPVRDWRRELGKRERWRRNRSSGLADAAGVAGVGAAEPSSTAAAEARRGNVENRREVRGRVLGGTTDAAGVGRVERQGAHRVDCPACCPGGCPHGAQVGAPGVGPGDDRAGGWDESPVGNPVAGVGAPRVLEMERVREAWERMWRQEPVWRGRSRVPGPEAVRVLGRGRGRVAPGWAWARRAWGNRRPPALAARVTSLGLEPRKRVASRGGVPGPPWAPDEPPSFWLARLSGAVGAYRGPRRRPHQGLRRWVRRPSWVWA